MFKARFFANLLLFACLPCTLVYAQTDPIGRPRRTETPQSTSDLAEPTVPSAAASAEAKRLYKAGVKYGLSGLFKEAADHFERAVRLKPDYADAYLSLGHAYMDLRQWPQAVQNLERGLELKPKDKDGIRRLAHARWVLDQERSNQVRKTPGTNARSNRADGSPASLSSAKLSSSNRATNVDLTSFYRVGPGDVLDVRLSDAASDQPTLFTLTPAGLLEHPDLSAPLTAAGLTVEEIGTRFEDDLKKRAKASKVSVAVSEYVSHTILVSGLVKEPGAKVIKREAIPLYVVVADAQALPEAGTVSVLRHNSNESFLIDLSKTADMAMLIRPGDVISLQANPTQFFYVSGEVKSPGEKQFRSGLTLTQAIIAAGGTTKDSKEARVARDNGRGFLAESRYKLKDINSGKVPDPAIKAGDRITIFK
jgi:protein involved in polysaccharide export with SLBB domain